MTEEELAQIEARLAAFLAPAEDDSSNQGMGLGASKCGCYGTSGPYIMQCEGHDPEKLAETVSALVEEVRRLRSIEMRVRAFMKAHQQAHKVRIDAAAYLIATEKELAQILELA